MWRGFRVRVFRRQAALVSVAACAVLGGCAGRESTGVPSRVPSRVLFVGNSYLLFYDIPGIVQAMAVAAGDSVEIEVLARPNAALIDHWKDGSAERVIAEKRWSVVVLQQGPSSVAVNRDTLRLATALFADAIRRRGGTVALFSAWPASDRRQDFPRAIESYALAAADVRGIFLPVASAWLSAWGLDATFDLYSDGLHASPDGAYLSALVVYGRLFDRSPVGQPATIVTAEGFTIEVDPVRALTLQQAAVAALSASR